MRRGQFIEVLHHAADGPRLLLRVHQTRQVAADRAAAEAFAPNGRLDATGRLRLDRAGAEHVGKDAGVAGVDRRRGVVVQHHRVHGLLADRGQAGADRQVGLIHAEAGGKSVRRGLQRGRAGSDRGRAAGPHGRGQGVGVGQDLAGQGLLRCLTLLGADSGLHPGGKVFGVVSGLRGGRRGLLVRQARPGRRIRKGKGVDRRLIAVGRLLQIRLVEPQVAGARIDPGTGPSARPRRRSNRPPRRCIEARRRSSSRPRRRR